MKAKFREQWLPWVRGTSIFIQHMMSHSFCWQTGFQSQNLVFTKTEVMGVGNVLNSCSFGLCSSWFEDKNWIFLAQSWCYNPSSDFSLFFCFFYLLSFYLKFWKIVRNGQINFKWERLSLLYDEAGMESDWIKSSVPVYKTCVQAMEPQTNDRYHK